MRTKKQNENKMMCAIGEATVNNNGKYGKKVTRMKSFPDTCVCVCHAWLSILFRRSLLLLFWHCRNMKNGKNAFFSFFLFFSLATCVRVVHVTTPSVYSPCVVCGVLLLFFSFLYLRRLVICHTFGWFPPRKSCCWFFFSLFPFSYSFSRLLHALLPLRRHCFAVVSFIFILPFFLISRCFCCLLLLLSLLLLLHHLFYFVLYGTASSFSSSSSICEGSSLCI